MNKPCIVLVMLSLVAALLLPESAEARNRNSGRLVQLGARQHVEHSEFEELPFDDDTYSYGLGLQVPGNQVFWQIALGYAPDVNDTVDYVLTPQINLILHDRYWRAGTGILGSYITGEDEEGEDVDDWTDVYWQMQLGFSLPVGQTTLDISAFYTYETWGDLGDFDFSDVEFGVWLGFPF